MFTKNEDARTREIPMASLADIAFLLLIFFLVSTTINIDRGIGLTLPDAERIPIPPKNICNLLINASGEIRLDDGVISMTELVEIVEQKLAENPNLIFSIKTDRRTKYDMYIGVLDRLKLANATRISITEPEKRAGI